MCNFASQRKNEFVDGRDGYLDRGRRAIDHVPDRTEMDCADGQPRFRSSPWRVGRTIHEC